MLDRYQASGLSHIRHYRMNIVKRPTGAGCRTSQLCARLAACSGARSCAAQRERREFLKESCNSTFGPRLRERRGRRLLPCTHREPPTPWGETVRVCTCVTTCGRRLRHESLRSEREQRQSAAQRLLQPPGQRGEGTPGAVGLLAWCPERCSYGLRCCVCVRVCVGACKPQ